MSCAIMECQYDKCRIFYCYAECRYAKCRIFYCYAECRYAECRYVECRVANIYDILLLGTNRFLMSCSRLLLVLVFLIRIKIRTDSDCK